MARVVGISQSNYIPWKGYFDLLHRCDLFLLYEDAQYTRRDWRNRNRIKTPDGVQWLTVPVEVKGKFEQRIRDTLVQGTDWAANHFTRLRHAYGKAPHFARYAPAVEVLFEQAVALTHLSAVNELFLRHLCGVFGIGTELVQSADYYIPDGDATDRLLNMCVKAGASAYLSGPAAKGYLDEAKFRAAGIEVRWMEYTGYPEYPQPHGPFEHSVSALDLLFCVGPSANSFLERGRHAA